MNPVREDELDAVLMGVARRKDLPGALDIAAGVTRQITARTMAAAATSAMAGDPAEQQTGARRITKSSSDQTAGLAEHPEVVILVADHVQRQDGEGSETERSPGAFCLPRARRNESAA